MGGVSVRGRGGASPQDAPFTHHTKKREIFISPDVTVQKMLLEFTELDGSEKFFFIFFFFLFSM